MADIVVTPILERLIGTALDLIANEIIITAKVGDALKRLFEVLESIEAADQVAEKRAGHDRVISIWLKRLNDVAYDAEDILDLVATKGHEVRKPVISCVSETLFKRKIGHKIKDLLERVKTICDEKEIFNLGNPEPVTNQENLPNRETGSRSSGVVVGREIEKENIINALLAPADLSNPLVVIPIIGMGGVGKTTLAQLISNDKKISDKEPGEKKKFDISMWVHVGQKFSATEILKELMEYIPEYSKDIQHLSLNQLQGKVGGFLAGKCFFLVLDDVWTEKNEEWNRIKDVLKRGKSGSAVLVTSRNMEVAKMMGADSETQQLKTLNTDESWELFCKCAFGTDVVVPEDLKEIGKQITKTCEGLPLAINALGKLLFSKKNDEYWMEVLRNDITVLEEKGQVTVLQLLKLSFDNLPSFLKPCFLLLSIFPKGHCFEKSKLVKIWTAEGYIQLYGRDNPEDVGNRYFDELCDRSFFLSSGITGDHSYKMHDLHHDLALSMSGTKYTQVKEKTSNNTEQTSQVEEETSNNTEQSSQVKEETSNTIEQKTHEEEEISKPIDQNSQHITILCDNIKKSTLVLTRKFWKVRTILLSGENLRYFGKIPDEEKVEEIQNSRHISILCDNIKKSTLVLTRKCQKVRTILLPGENLRYFGKIPDEEKVEEIQKKQILEKKILNDLFHSLKCIRVLDLSSSSIEALPNSIKKMQLLHYLDLSKTAIRMLPASICDLWAMESSNSKALTVSVAR